MNRRLENFSMRNSRPPMGPAFREYDSHVLRLPHRSSFGSPRDPCVNFESLSVPESYKQGRESDTEEEERRIPKFKRSRAPKRIMPKTDAEEVTPEKKGSTLRKFIDAFNHIAEAKSNEEKENSEIFNMTHQSVFSRHCDLTFQQLEEFFQHYEDETYVNRTDQELREFMKTYQALKAVETTETAFRNTWEASFPHSNPSLSFVDFYRFFDKVGSFK